jgi:cytochrome b
MDHQDAAAQTALPRIPVWDAPVRIVHWSIVLLIAVLVSTGLAGGDWLAWHMRAGQVLLALVLFRIAWGFAGSPNARFRTFLRGPRLAVRYARALARRQKEPYATHNPLGAWMVVLLLLALLAQAGTGLFTNDDVLWDGPLVKWVTKETSDALSSFHRRFWWVLLALAAVHIVAAVTYLVALRDNLIGAMFTGRKRLPPGFADPLGAQASPVKAIALAAVVGIAVWLVLHRL